MIGAIRTAWANFRGFDLTGSTVPPMDGPLRPNAKLDAMPVLLRLDEIDNLTAAGGRLFGSVGAELLTLEAGDDQTLTVAARDAMPGSITAIAASGERMAIAVAGEGIRIEGGTDGSRLVRPDGFDPAAVTAMAFAGPGTLFVAVGSKAHSAADWKRDLMTRTAAGSVWRVDLPEGRATLLAEGLGFPSGVAVAGDRLFVSEAWRHRVLSMRLDGGDRLAALDALPAYPGRITPAAGGGFWLAMFAPRNPLVEFVLKEDEYRRRMVATIDPAYWIAPSLVTGKSFLEPIQGGARKKLNMLKPWSPTWSTGLVARCNGEMGMLRSYHSRADGEVHGVTSVAEFGGRLLIGAKGSGKVVALDERAEASVQ